MYQCIKNTEHKLSGTFSVIEDSVTKANIKGSEMHLSELTLQFSKSEQRFKNKPEPQVILKKIYIHNNPENFILKYGCREG